MKTKTIYERQDAKSIRNLIVSHFKRRHKLSQGAAETIFEETSYLLNHLNKQQNRSPGQIIFYSVHKNEPAGKKLSDCELLPVKLTIYDDKDRKIRKEKGLQFLNCHIIERITNEALAQNALLTQEDLSIIMRCSRRSIIRYLQKLRTLKKKIPLRGDYTDLGRGKSHKKKILSLFLLNYSETEIKERMHHCLSQVETYIRDFIRILLLKENGYGAGAIVRIAKLSKSLVSEYLTIINEFAGDSFYKEPLEKVINRYGETLQINLKKKGVNIK